MPRLFTGLEIPATIAYDLAGLQGGLPGARWIDPEDFHVTLAFIGDVSPSTAHDIADLLSRLEKPFFARLAAWAPVQAACPACSGLHMVPN